MQVPASSIAAGYWVSPANATVEGSANGTLRTSSEASDVLEQANKRPHAAALLRPSAEVASDGV